MRKLARTQLRAWAVSHARTVQGGLCPLCLKPLNLGSGGRDSDYVVDHNHVTGEIRGVLHRSCNAALGKVDNAIGRWGAKSMDYTEIIPWLRNMLAFYEQPGTGLMYPGHKTPEEVAEARRVKRNKAAAARRAAAKVRTMPRKET